MIRNDLGTVTPGSLDVLSPGLAGVWTTLVPSERWRPWFCCLKGGDLFGVELCCSLPVHALCVCVCRGGEIPFASWISVLLPATWLKPHRAWSGVSGPSLVPLRTEMPWHQLNTTAAPKVQDLPAWMQTEKELFKISFFRAKSALDLMLQVLPNSWFDFQAKGQAIPRAESASSPCRLRGAWAPAPFSLVPLQSPGLPSQQGEWWLGSLMSQLPLPGPGLGEQDGTHCQPAHEAAGMRRGRGMATQSCCEQDL